MTLKCESTILHDMLSRQDDYFSQVDTCLCLCMCIPVNVWTSKFKETGIIGNMVGMILKEVRCMAWSRVIDKRSQRTSIGATYLKMESSWLCCFMSCLYHLLYSHYGACGAWPSEMMSPTSGQAGEVNYSLYEWRGWCIWRCIQDAEVRMVIWYMIDFEWIQNHNTVHTP